MFVTAPKQRRVQTRLRLRQKMAILWQHDDPDTDHLCALTRRRCVFHDLPRTTRSRGYCSFQQFHDLPIDFAQNRSFRSQGARTLDIYDTGNSVRVGHAGMKNGQLTERNESRPISISAWVEVVMMLLIARCCGCAGGSAENAPVRRFASFLSNS